MTIKLTSSAFKEGAIIPAQYSCDGKDISPPLSWSEVPGGTKSFALICDDPDAPIGTWVHWIVYNIPDNVTSLPENVPPNKSVMGNILQGMTDFRRIGYGGPCPPRGTHRYYFKIYALDTMLNLSAGATKRELLRAMEGHILAEGQIMGRYGR
jgi:Raf kinase inhibitor-like YbhB/YbcL family protein